jgi:hypothetical protein
LGDIDQRSLTSRCKIPSIDIRGTPEMFAKRMAMFGLSNSRYQRSYSPYRGSNKKSIFPALAGKVDISEVSRELFALPVKFAGIAIPNPITLAETNCKDSVLVCSYLIRALRGQEVFSPSKHRETRTAVIQACNERRVEEYESTF